MGLGKAILLRRLRVREFLFTQRQRGRRGRVLFSTPRQFFADFLAPIGFGQRIVSQIGDLIGRFDERFFFSIHVALERLHLGQKLTEIFFFLLQESLFEER